LHGNGFREALEFARHNQQIGVWDTGEHGSLLAIWDGATEVVVTLDADQALPILASDQEISRLWRRWRGMTGQAGCLIIVDEARCRAFLAGLERVGNCDE
jgi:hypothetical protein